jgi:hypothetical protein
MGGGTGQDTREVSRRPTLARSAPRLPTSAGVCVDRSVLSPPRGAMADEAQAPNPARFTARELAAAEQLIHLSESSCSSSYAAALPRGSAASASSTSSPRSVNAPPQPATPIPPPPPAAAAAEDDEEDEEEDQDQQEVGGRRRRNKRYRPIAEIYAASSPEPVGVGAGARRRKADGRHAGSQEL